MRVNFAFTTILTTVFSVITETWAAPDPNFHIYLAFGQSNMQGAGTIENQDKTVDKRFQMMATAGGCNNRRVGEWYDAIPPLAHCGGGLGPVDYFGRTLVKKLPQEIKVGVAVVAVAGCGIELFDKNKYQSYDMPDWMRGIVSGYGGNPYGRLVEVGKKAKQYGVIKGILLHQGESNTGDPSWPNNVKNIYDNLMKDIGLNPSEVPLLAGEVVSSGAGGACASHNGVIARLPQVIPNAHVISSNGLGQQGDGLHFTSAAYRTFGERFAETMLKLLGNVEVVDNSNNNSNTNDNNNNPNNNQNQNQDSCWSTKLNYPCCKSCIKVDYTDSDGDWGIENNNWCGIPKNCSANNNASQCIGAQGYPCCKNTCDVLETDGDGQWSVEGGDWCLIDKSKC
ncbi:family 6 carbohydrate esterase [Piromyces sp. E2]|nr:family 6 carbohydrate esterase [Piromyces sp. E2]|eukprot:OUM57315.1 family 6 carbohydrate esterase [Piromyces sp. E2]